jgi:hypothetical protein
MSAFGRGCHSTVAVVPVNIVALYNDIFDQYILGLSKIVMYLLSIVGRTCVPALLCLL